MKSLVKILLIISSFVLPQAGSKKNNEKPQAPPTPRITHITNVDLTAAEQTIRGFGGATVFHPDLTGSDLNTLFNNANYSPPGLMVADGFTERTKFNVNSGIASALFLVYVRSDTKNLTIEDALDLTGTSFMYDLTSLNITTLSQIRKVLVVKRTVAVTSEII